jgi:hypothetical protein
VNVVYTPPGDMCPTPLAVVNHMSLPLAAMQPTPLMVGAIVFHDTGARHLGQVALFGDPDLPIPTRGDTCSVRRMIQRELRIHAGGRHAADQFAWGASQGPATPGLGATRRARRKEAATWAAVGSSPKGMT